MNTEEMNKFTGNRINQKAKDSCAEFERFKTERINRAFAKIQKILDKKHEDRTPPEKRKVTLFNKEVEKLEAEHKRLIRNCLVPPHLQPEKLFSAEELKQLEKFREKKKKLNAYYAIEEHERTDEQKELIAKHTKWMKTITKKVEQPTLSTDRIVHRCDVEDFKLIVLEKAIESISRMELTEEMLARKNGSTLQQIKDDATLLNNTDRETMFATLFMALESMVQDNPNKVLMFTKRIASQMVGQLVSAEDKMQEYMNTLLKCNIDEATVNRVNDMVREGMPVNVAEAIAQGRATYNGERQIQLDCDPLHPNFKPPYELYKETVILLHTELEILFLNAQGWADMSKSYQLEGLPWSYYSDIDQPKAEDFLPTFELETAISKRREQIAMNKEKQMKADIATSNTMQDLIKKREQEAVQRKKQTVGE